VKSILPVNLVRKLAILLFVLPLSLTGQEQETFWFHKLQKEDGLSDNQAMDFFQDSEGFMWIGAQAGLNRFDGLTIKQYKADKLDSTRLRDDFISGNFFEDGKKNIWFCTQTAIHRYDRKTDKFTRRFIRDKRGLDLTDGYFAIYLERDSFLWVRAGNKNLYRFDIHRLDHTDELGKINFDVNIFPGISKGGRLKFLFSVDGGKSPGLEIFEFDENGNRRNHQTFFTGGSDPELNIHSVIYEGDTAIWMSANTGLFKWDMLNNKIQPFPSQRSNTTKIVAVDPDRFLVAELGHGLSYFHKSAGRFSILNAKLIEDQDFNLSASFKNPYLDSSGNLWGVVHYNEGLTYLNLDKIKLDAIPKMALYNGNKNYAFRTMIQAPDGSIWCSTYVDGFFLLDEEGTVLRHYHPNGPVSGCHKEKQFNHLLLDREQNLWAGCPRGVTVMPFQTSCARGVVDMYGRDVPYAVYFYQLAGGEILVSTLQKGIYQVMKVNGEWKLKQVYAPQDDSDFHTTIYEDKLGSIYICRKFNSLSVFNFQQGELEWLTDLPVSGFINGFYEDENGGNIWIATSSGLARIDKTDLQAPPKLYSEREGLLNKNIQSIAPGSDGRIWLGTGNGLVVFDPEKETFHHFSLPDGMQSTQFDPLAVLRHRNGTLWFGGNNGITIVDPGKIQYLLEPPKIQITGLKINDEPPVDLRDEKTGATNINQVEHLKLPFKWNTLSFEFVAIDYSDPRATQLEYYLEKVDKNWVRLEKGGPGFARYSNIPPGYYTFRIRGTNSDGKSDREASEKRIYFRIKPPFWRTWWFISLSLLAIAAGIVALFRYRIRQAREKEQLNTRAAESKLAALRAQMNPHFIFNSLNSINSYILGNDTAGATRYLAKFAKLMRLIFDLSLHTVISLEKEIEMLELYLQVEIMRFKTPFTYDIEVDEDLDPYETQIPPMLLQPFVENAIWHGLAHRETPGGRLQVKIGEDHLYLKCSIIDNGVGRARAAEIKAQKGRSHRSGAIENIRQRLSLLPFHKDRRHTIEIRDLFDEQGRPAGTMVEIFLPLE
jgi:ligand-binding sensor domain-containing protein